MKKISIIVPCYNVENYVEKCLCTLVSQTIGIENLEIILVDDASTDGTLKILKEFERMYPKSILVIACSKNGKQGTARNIGMQYAKADYIGFVDSDDWVDLTMYEKLYDKAIEYDCDMVFCNGLGMKNDKEIARSTYMPFDSQFIEISNVDDRKQFARSGVVPMVVWLKIYKKSVIFDNKIFFPERLSYEDLYWGPITHYFVNRVYAVGEHLHFYRNNPESTMRVKNATHHFDRLDVSIMTVNFFKERGMFAEYKNEIEYGFLLSFYVGAVDSFIKRFDTMPLEVVIEMRKILLSLFPNYKNNPYLHCLSPFQKVILDIADIEFTMDDSDKLNEIAKLYRNKRKELMEKLQDEKG